MQGHAACPRSFLKRDCNPRLQSSLRSFCVGCVWGPNHLDRGFIGNDVRCEPSPVNDGFSVAARSGAVICFVLPLSLLVCAISDHS